MKMQRIAIFITVINLIVLIVSLTKFNTASAEQNPTRVQVIRAKGLEIIDSLGRLRASITLQPQVEQNGKFFPGSILFRLIDTKGQPVVKFEASEDGGGLSFSNEAQGYIQLLSHENGGFLKIKNADGKERIIQP